MKIQIHSVFAEKSLLKEKKSFISTELLGDIKHYMTEITHISLPSRTASLSSRK